MYPLSSSIASVLDDTTETCCAKRDITVSSIRNNPPISTEIGSLSELIRSGEVIAKLRSIDWSFTDAHTGYLSHDIHPYPAKFIPQLPRTLISQLSLRGEVVYDPFGGSATTALEAILLGRRSLSSDVHPLSKVIGEAKTITLTVEEDFNVVSFANELLLISEQKVKFPEIIAPASSEKYIPPIPNITKWFHENAISELAYLRFRIDSLRFDAVKSLALVALSKSILKASFQDEETRYARRPREVTPGTVIKLFATNLQSTLKKVRALGPLLQFRRAEFRTLDLRNAVLGRDLESNSVDLVVTSPPYPNTNDYHLYHRFRLFWLGYDPRELADKEIGSHLRHQKQETGFDFYLHEMASCLGKLQSVLRPGRFAVFVVGDGVFEGRLYSTSDSLAEMAANCGFEVVGIIPRNVHATKRSFMSSARRLRLEQLLILRKPDVSARLTCLEPPYKLWPYEQVLQRMELERLLPSASNLQAKKLQVRTNALGLDKLRRLTFVHAISGQSTGTERTWQAILENGDVFVSSRRKDPKYVTHGIHPYKGKFYPQLAKALFNLAAVDPGNAVLDPFCGSGTVLLEAYLNGLKAVGTDLNILAWKIAHVKTELLEVDAFKRDRLLSEFQKQLDQPSESEDDLDGFSPAVWSELTSWFPRPVLRKLGWIFRIIQDVNDVCVREAIEILVSSIVRQVSQQEPRDLRIRRRKKSIHDAPVYELLVERVRDLRRRLKHFSERSAYAPSRFLPAKAIHGDSRELAMFAKNGVQSGSIDTIVTSPPYATALPYIDTDRLSILLLFAMESKRRAQIESSLIGTREIRKQGRNSLDARIDGGDFEGILSETAISIISEIRKLNRASDGGFRKQNTAALLYLYFRDMSKVFANLNCLLKNGGSAFFVIGDNQTVAGDKLIRVKTTRALKEIGEAIGWEMIRELPITVTTENRFHVRNSITTNTILCFKKPQYS
jgi:tRNA G10  N-methylase Trm11